MYIRYKAVNYVTIKAEDRPSGLAGDSASVIVSAFLFSVKLRYLRVLVATERSDVALVSRQAHANIPLPYLKGFNGQQHRLMII